MNRIVDPDEVTEIIPRTLEDSPTHYYEDFHMFFMYVYIEGNDNMMGECFPISISYFDKASCLRKNLTLIRSLVESEGLDWEEVSRVEVETGEDCNESGYPLDGDNPATEICYIRENL